MKTCERYHLPKSAEKAQEFMGDEVLALSARVAQLDVDCARRAAQVAGLSGRFKAERSCVR